MQGSESAVQTIFVLHPELITLRYGYGDLTFRKYFLFWGAPSALGIAGNG